MTWHFDPTLYKYVNEDGDNLDSEYLLDLVYEDAENNEDEIEILAELLVLGLITLAAWIIAMRLIIEAEYIRMYLVAIGGLAMMTQEDWDNLAVLLNEQYEYLDNFANDIASGIMAFTIAAVAARAMLYLYSATQAFWIAITSVAKAWGATQERWITRQDKEVCPDCLAFEAEGWKPLGYFPVPGSATRCLSNCRCVLERRNADGVVF